MTEVLESLVASSSLTPRQLQILGSYVRVASGELTLKEATQLVSPGRLKGNSRNPLTVGSYHRTVAQARGNIKESLVSLFIAVSLDLLSTEDVRRLLELAHMGSRELSEAERRRLLDLVSVLLDRIVR